MVLEPLEFFIHQSLIAFLGPQGPSSFETQGLLISIVLEEEQAEIKVKNDRIKIIFFILLNIVPAILIS